MRIEPLSMTRIPQVSVVERNNESRETQAGGFGDTIKKSIAHVNDLQTQADQAAIKVATGDPIEIHQAMIAMSKASTALQFTVQVRNKVIEAYQEISRMQV